MTKNITFTLPAEAMEGATEAYLLGDFNNWNPEKAPKLEKQKDGSFKTVTKLEEGKTYQYRFLLNDGRWVNDYNAQNYTTVEGLYVDNCVITVPVSEKKETKKASPAKSSAATKKEVKAKVETKSPAAATPAKKATAKAVPAKSVKSATAKAKVTSVKAEKASKPAVKKTTPKAAPKAKK